MARLLRTSRSWTSSKESEHSHQVALVNYAKAMALKDPRWSLLFAIPNAGAGAQRGQAGKMKAEGVRAGVPDLFLPVPVRPWHGLFIEMKFNRNKLSPAQENWTQILTEKGYSVKICYSSGQAIDTIAEYLGKHGDESRILKMTGYDSCITGMVERFGWSEIVCYDKKLVLEQLVKEGMTHEEALEWWEFNMVGAWVGERTPAFLTKIDTMDEEDRDALLGI